MKTRPSVLIIDDRVDGSVRVLVAVLRRRLYIKAIHPEELTDDAQQSLWDADLVLVDLALDEWDTRREADSLAQRPMDGLAVAAVLKSQVRNRPNSKPKAFAILSGQIDQYSAGLPAEQREHVFPRLHDLEWAFPKSGSRYKVPLDVRVSSLAKAVSSLPKSWTRNPMANTRKLLGLGESEWSYQAWEDIEKCHPPIHEISTHSHGLAFLRWLLHRILPYPCFLWDSHGLASRLRVSHASFVKALKNPRFRGKLSSIQYNGVLADFLGDRWWRAGAESLIWAATQGQPQDDEKLRSVLAKGTSVRLASAEGIAPVVCLDGKLNPLDAMCDRREAVRIQPDDWPPYADQAWASLELARQDPRIKSIVIVQDRERLKDVG